MQIIKRTDSLSYGVNDVVAIVSDSHQWSPMELDTSVFTIETIPDLLEAEVSRLLMNDDGFINNSSISKLPTFRSLSTQFTQTRLFHKRKYQYVNGSIVLKDNAQVYDG